MSVGARWRALKSNRRLPTYVIFAAIGALLIALVVRRHIVSEYTIVLVVVFVPAVICHEVSHGLVALWCGDDTAKRAGRLTVNPLKHIDPVGSILVPLVLVLTTGSIFGWAKPVPVAVNRLRHPRNQSVLVSLAGPATNLILASIAGLTFHELVVHVWTPPLYCSFYVCTFNPANFALVEQIVFYFGFVNIILALFNLIPIPPLDGSALVERLIPASALPGYYRMRMWFLIVVLAFVFIFNTELGNVFVNIETWFFRVCR
ncbi:MAG: site-2 protease family protein [Acidimicrobiales bacterium]